MSSRYGKNISVSIFGQSHSNAIGVCIDGLPAGEKIDFDELNRFLDRRAPGKNNYSTSRKEADQFEVLSGIVNDKTCGAPFSAIIKNKDQHSKDYSELKEKPRPAHADFTAHVKYNGYQDVAGGGHFSGRLTAPLCIAGGICLQLLKKNGIEIGAHIYSIGGIKDISYNMANIESLQPKDEFPVFDMDSKEKMLNCIAKNKEVGDSVGGIIECAVVGLPIGLGEPIFDGVENKIASIIFGVPAVKGIEFGNGFGCADITGSENNDNFYYDNGQVKTKTNNCGGILGGITNGMPLVFRTAIKPTPSISMEQDTISLVSKKDTKLKIKGRHDPCIVPRAVPVIEAATAIAIYDMFLESKHYK